LPGATCDRNGRSDSGVASFGLYSTSRSAARADPENDESERERQSSESHGRASKI
jgi:hypothetical protein